MAKKQDNFYYTGFGRLANYSTKAANFLQEILENYTPDNLGKFKDEMHDIEHSADLEKHVIIEKLVKEFITPIDREDIMGIAQRIDDVTDAIEDVLLRLYMYNVQTIRPAAIEFCKIIHACSVEMNNMIAELPNFKKSSALKAAIIEINNLEEVGDRLYINAVRDLFVEENSAREIYTWEQLFYRFEKCCDMIENLADFIEEIIMKNT